MPPRIIDFGLSGLGPRNAQYLMFLAVLLLANRDRFANMRIGGIDFVLHVTVFEKQDANHAGSGNAFQIDCDAATNTSVTGLPNIVGIDNIDPAFKSIVDLAGNVATKMQAERSVILGELERRNPVAAVLFRKALRSDGTVNTATACMTRGQWGRIQRDKFFEALDYIKTNMPELVITIHYEYEVVDTDFSAPRKPCLVVKRAGETAQARHQFDFVIFANGTPLVSPVCPDVAPKTYSLTPNHDTLSAFLQHHGILDEDGYVIPGKSILITGKSLSSYDYATLLMAFLHGFRLNESNPVGYEFDEAKALQYKGLITFVSRSERGPAPPRIAPDIQWRGATPILTTKGMHTLRLQRTYNWLDPAYEFLEADVARSTGQVPARVNSSKTAEEYMSKYYADSLDHLMTGNSNQETALLCAGYMAFVVGSGFETDNPEIAEGALIQEAPFTREGRAGWPLFSASGVEMSLHAMMDTPENAVFFKHWLQMHHFAAASPPIIQHSIALLFKSGIAQHQNSTFDQIGIMPAGDKVVLADSLFDVALAPKVISREDDVLRSCVRQVREIMSGTPEYGKGMHFKTVNGKPINAIDVGLGGWGTVAQNKHQEPRTVGKILNGTNSHHAAADWASNFALQTLLLSVALVVCPNDSPIKTIAGFYDQTLPAAAVFKAEVASFKPVWREVQEKLLFLRLCKELAGSNAAKYRTYTDQIFTRATRNSFLNQVHNDDPHHAETYAIALNSLPKFDPPTLTQYERRFSCFTRPQLNAMWDHMFNAFLASAENEDEEMMNAYLP